MKTWELTLKFYAFSSIFQTIPFVALQCSSKEANKNTKMNEILSTPARSMRGRNAAKKRSIYSEGVPLPTPAVAFMRRKREKGH